MTRTMKKMRNNLLYLDVRRTFLAFKKMRENGLLFLYAWYRAQRELARGNVFAWNQLMDLGIVIGLLFVFVQNNSTLSTLFTTIVTAVQTQLQKLITTNTL